MGTGGGSDTGQARRHRGVRADRTRLTAALAASDLPKKTQAALAERIADMEGLENVPRDLVSRIFREQAVDAQSIARVAMALHVPPDSLYLDEPAGDDAEPAGKPKPNWVLAGLLVVAALATGSLVMAGNAFSPARQQDRMIQRTEVSIYAEIGDIYRHYLYSADELVSDPADRTFRLQLKLAAYGAPSSTRSQVADIGLSPDETRLAMELLLLVRNNDSRIEDILERPEAGDAGVSAEVETLRARMRDARDVAYSVLQAMNRRNPDLGPVPDKPPDYQQRL